MGRLALTRRSNESVRIGKDIIVKVVTCGRKTTRLLIEAPDHVPIVRSELEGSRDAQVEEKSVPEVNGPGDDHSGG